MVPFIFSMHEIPVAVLLWSGRVQESLRLSFRQWGCWLWGRDLCWASCFAEGETEAAGSDGAGMGCGPLSPPLHELFFAATAGRALVKSPFPTCNVCCRWNVSCSFSRAVPGAGIGLEGRGFLLSLLLSPDSWFSLGTVHDSSSGGTRLNWH